MTGADLPDLIDAYISERTVRGHFRPRTGITVLYTLRSLQRHMDRHPGPLDIPGWLDSSRVAPATARSRLSQVSMFCRWLVRHGHLDADPTIDIDGPRMPRYVPRGLNGDQVGAVLEQCPDNRARLIVLLMCQEGLRCCEVAGLELGDFDFADRVMLVSGKGGHQRVLPVSAESWSALQEYLAEWPAAAGPVVRSYNDAHRPLDAAYVSTLVAGWMRDAGVPATAHALRHTAASDMLKSGAHLRTVQAALGHASLSTTQRYLPWVVGDLREAMAGRQYGRAARAILRAESTG